MPKFGARTDDARSGVAPGLSTVCFHHHKMLLSHKYVCSRKLTSVCRLRNRKNALPKARILLLWILRLGTSATSLCPARWTSLEINAASRVTPTLLPLPSLSPPSCCDCVRDWCDDCILERPARHGVVACFFYLMIDNGDAAPANFSSWFLGVLFLSEVGGGGWVR